MRVMLDTNILISAVLFPGGRTAQALLKAFSPPYEPVVCDDVVDELHRKFQEKFPDKTTELDAFLYNLLAHIEFVPTPETENPSEVKIRDAKDRPILRAALSAHVDLLLTGDKDFLESAISVPRIVSVMAFLDA